MDFVNVPMTVDPSRATNAPHHGGQRSFESLYLSAVEDEQVNPDAMSYELKTMIENVLNRLLDDKPEYSAVLINTHYNMNYSNTEYKATQNFESFFAEIRLQAERKKTSPEVMTLKDVFKAIFSDNE